MVNELDSRVAVVETKVDSIESSLEELKSKMEEHEKQDEVRMQEIRNTLQKIGEQLSTSKSFVGGIIFVLSCLWAVFLAFKETVFHNVVSK